MKIKNNIRKIQGSRFHKTWICLFLQNEVPYWSVVLFH